MPVTRLLILLLAVLIGCSTVPEITAEPPAHVLGDGLTPTWTPLDIPAIRRCGMWVPGVGVTNVPGGREWASLANEPNAFSDVHTGDKPVLDGPVGHHYWNHLAGGT